jgi:hypothetical protein
MAEHLPNKCEALSSSPSIKKQSKWTIATVPLQLSLVAEFFSLLNRGVAG